MTKRKRKVYEKLEPIQKDELAFEKNKSTERAKLVTTQVESLEIDIWFDKHYYDRLQHGDDNGKREGIEIETVTSLVTASIKHLFYYSTKLKHFVFVNHHDEITFGRIVLQQRNAGHEILNIVIECHYISLNKYEVTVKTAMCEDGFHFSQGQYIIEMVSSDESYLNKKDDRKIIKISNYSK